MIIINFLAFQICWMMAVWGAANSVSWLGPAAVTLFAIWELSRSQATKQLLQMLLLVALLGLTVDTAYRLFGLIEYASPWPSPRLAPLWIVTMWMSFALTIDSSMRWLKGKPMLAAIFGLIGGPLAYWIAAEVWGAARFTAPLPLALGAVGLAWAVITPLLFVLSAALTSPREFNSTQRGMA